MIYAYAIHTCLDVALMEGDLYPLWFLKEHPLTGAAYSQPLVEATIFTHSKYTTPQLSQKMQNLMWEYITCAPASKTRFGNLGGISFRLL